MLSHHQATAAGPVPPGPSAVAKQPQLVPGPDTTVFTGPRLANGTIHYAEAWNREFGWDVTPQDNAAAALFRLMRRPLINPGYDQRLAERLGLDPQEPGQPIEPWPDDAEAREVFEQARAGPWQAERFPAVADWLERNRATLDAIAPAVRRPRYWWPRLSPRGGPTRLDQTAAPQLGESRHLARCLMMRAYHYLGYGRLDAALADLQTMQRLGQTIGREKSYIALLVDYSIQAIAAPVAEHLLAHPKVQPRHATAVLDLSQTSRSAAQLKATYRWELKLIAIERLLYEFHGVSDDWREQEPEVFRAMRSEAFDINVALAHLHTVFDDWPRGDVETFRHNERATEQLVERFQKGMDLEQRLAASADDPGRVLSQWVAERVFFPEQFPTLGHRSRLWTNARIELTRVAAALTLHKLEHGRYPATLDALTPHPLKALPIDRYDGRPLTYRPGPDRLTYRLYGVGPNGKDDHGRDDFSDGDLAIGNPVARDRR